MAEEGSCRILTWNINGIRSLADFPSVLAGLPADIVCLQETKVTRDLLAEAAAIVPGFSSYFAFSRRRPGYSGVATFCRTAATPAGAEEGLAAGLPPGPGLPLPGAAELAAELLPEERRALDAEGRCVITRHEVGGGARLAVINVYCPRADPERPDRQRFKLLFYRALAVRAAALRAAGDRVIVLGDINTCHRETDHCQPYEGFRDRPDRRFLDHFILTPGEEEPEEGKEEDEEEEWRPVGAPVEGKQFLDAFRLLHPAAREVFTCWNTEKNCRATNYGTRIDYILASVDLRQHLTSCEVLGEVQGSDHCPVTATLSLALQPAARPPATATLHFPEFAGRQAKLSSYFVKGVAPACRQAGAKVEAKTVKGEKRKITSFFAPKISDKKVKIAQEPAEDENQTQSNKQKCHAMSSSDEESEIASIPEQAPARSPPPARNSLARSAWGSMFRAAEAPPACPGHLEPAARRKVAKKGANTGREFWCCARGEGRAGDPAARCDFFKWIK
jgi:AP endonuclease-2